MPQVKWPGGSGRRLFPRWVWFVSVVGIVAIVLQILPLMQSQNVALAASRLPDPALDSNNMSLVISQSTDATVINAPQDYVKIYLDANATGTRSINIWNMPFNACNQDDTRPDWYGPTWTGCSGISTAANRTVMYDFFAMDANEDAPQPNPFTAMTLLLSVNGQTGAVSTGGTVALNAGGGWSGNINLPVAGTVVSNVTGYRVIVMRARYATGISAADCGDGTNCNTRLHSYQIRVTNPADQLGYWEAAPGSPPRDGQYIIHYLGGECSTTPSDCNGLVDHSEFDFAPSCLATSDQLATLKWYDADASPTEPIYFVFYEEDQNGNVQKTTTINDTSSPTDIGANNAYRELNFTAHPGWKYRWVWHNIIKPFGTGPNYGAANNIQMWLPFDSINYGLTCWNYHSTVASADNRANGATLDFSNPANQTVKFWVDARNIGSRTGPVARTTPTMSPGGWASLVTSDATDPQVNNGDINTAIPGASSITSYFGHGAKFEYKFDPLTPSGQYCFGDTIAPHTSTSAIAPSDNTICYIVKNDRRYPSLQGLNSDVHAGGGLCPNQSPGSVQGGNTLVGGGPNTYGQYVVSAAAVGGVGGMINNFGSDNSSGSSQLNIGKAGGYQQICRRDLYAYAESNKNLADPIQHQLGAGTYSVNNWSGIYYANGPVTISGTVSSKVTLVMESGDLSISGNLVLNGANSGPRNVPSMGIITNGPAQNIFINPAAQTVDAYIFSDGTIDTCATATVYAPPGCGNQLTIDGFLMAKSINFKRTGPDGTLGTQTGEQVRLTPQLYLNPPFFFDAGVDSNPLSGLGEKQPLF